ncbi:hypothetical protein [Dentiradicibacter hellwigii]|uniref:Uncharacterized protein n=1 Tax=Dentiradicibacter hellwigii TaxID=3149053 RepID=A0ABV4UI33_9RHOO
MDTSLNLIISLISGVIGGAITAYIGNRKIQIKNITQERAKWRDKIRELSIEVYKAAIEGKYQEIDKLQIEFAVRLNPYDDEDIGILETIYKLKDKQNQEESLSKKLEEFSDRVALLLKHDWERAKYEAEPWYSHLSLLKNKIFEHPPGRTFYSYEKLKKHLTKEECKKEEYKKYTHIIPYEKNPSSSQPSPD